jgi:hypothetical protein
MSRTITNKKSTKSRKKKDEEENEAEIPVVEVSQPEFAKNEEENCLKEDEIQLCKDKEIENKKHIEIDEEITSKENINTSNNAFHDYVGNHIRSKKERSSEEYNIFLPSSNNLSQTVNILQEETGLRKRNYNSTDTSSKRFLSDKESQSFSLEGLLLFTQTQLKINKELLIIIIYIGIYFFLMSFEFLYGLVFRQVDIISDSFFHIFKASALIITAASILLSKYFSNLTVIIHLPRIF